MPVISYASQDCKQQQPACDLYYIPLAIMNSSLSTWMRVVSLLIALFVTCRGVVLTDEKLMLIIERVPTNNGVRVVSSSGGVARDTITVVRVRECHEYWQRAGQYPVRKGTLRWDHPSPRLLDIAFIASTASATFRHYNLHVRQCYWYTRITLAAMAGASRLAPDKAVRRSLGGGLRCLGGTSHHKLNSSQSFTLSVAEIYTYLLVIHLLLSPRSRTGPKPSTLPHPIFCAV